MQLSLILLYLRLHIVDGGITFLLIDKIVNYLIMLLVWDAGRKDLAGV